MGTEERYGKSQRLKMSSDIICTTIIYMTYFPFIKKFAMTPWIDKPWRPTVRLVITQLILDTELVLYCSIIHRSFSPHTLGRKLGLDQVTIQWLSNRGGPKIILITSGVDFKGQNSRLVYVIVST